MIKLSYSSLKELQSCEQRFAHRKVYKTPVDSDYKESDALGVGKAFHQVLEKTKHQSWDESLLMEAMVDHNVEAEDKMLLTVMLDKYVKFRKASGIDVIYCEFAIDTPTYTGFIDAMGLDHVRKEWWLIDLKTTARHDPNIIPQLAKDMQVGLYSNFSDRIEESLPGFKGYTFAGFRYCQTVKSKAGTIKGLESGVKVIEMVIPKALIDTKSTWEMFLDNYMRAEDIAHGEVPKKNFASCFNYYSPCAYFSKCHGVEFSKGHKDIYTVTMETLEGSQLL